jgi:hypothetical protein
LKLVSDTSGLLRKFAIRIGAKMASTTRHSTPSLIKINWSFWPECLWHLFRLTVR